MFKTVGCSCRVVLLELVLCKFNSPWRKVPFKMCLLHVSRHLVGKAMSLPWEEQEGDGETELCLVPWCEGSWIC